MKKFILASAFALMATPALFAQSSNTYSMQIELKDGTKITLGPNDLKNITFVDGVIKIEGNTIEELRSSIEKAEANTKNMVEEQRYNVEALKQKASDLQAMIDYLSVKVAQLEKAEGGSGNAEDITALQAAIATLQSELAKLQNSEMALKTDVAATNEKINNVQAMVKATEAAIMDLQEAVKGLSSGNNSTGNDALVKELNAKVTAVEAALANLKNSSMNSQEQIDKLTVESNNVQGDLDATKEEFRANIQTLAAALAKTNNFAENEVANIRRNLDDMIEKVASINTAVDDAEKDRAAIYAAIDAVNKDRQAQAANLENKIETLDGYTKSMRTTLEGLIEKEKNDRMISINEVNKTILENYNELKEELYWITKFLNSNVLSDYNTFDNWLKEIQQR